MYSAALVLCCGKDEAEVKRRAEAIGRDADELREERRRRHARRGRRDAAEVAATPGAERIYLQVLDLSDLDHLSLIAAEVAPHLG